MNDETVPAVLRNQIATALLPYFCPQLRKGEHRSLAEIAASLNEEQLDMLLERYGVAGGGLDEFQSSQGNGKLQ